MFSIVIPTWNNLSYIQLCVESIRKNSAHPHQVILHINDGSDGTLAWAKAEQIDYTHTDDNAGICVAVNQAAALATQNYIVYMNDDMYVLPNWDSELIKEIKACVIAWSGTRIPTVSFFVFSILGTCLLASKMKV